MSKESRRKARLRKWHERKKHKKAESDYPFDEFARIFLPPSMRSYIYAEEDGY